MSLFTRYRQAVAKGELKRDPIQEAAARRLQLLSDSLRGYRPSRGGLFAALFGKAEAPRGLYIWGDVGRGKSMLMDLFFASAPVKAKRRVHFNAFMADAHAAIHAERQKGESDDPIPPVANAIAAGAALLCFDEFQVTDVADAMILGRLFEQLFALGTVIVATSNTAPERLYEGGLNRQLFLPFIRMIEERLDIVELDGPKDYRLQRPSGADVYMTPLGAAADAAMDAAWARLTDGAQEGPVSLSLLGRKLLVPRAAKGAARFSFADLCDKPLAAVDYLKLAHIFRTVLIDHIPVLGPDKANAARRFALLIDTLYDEGVKLIVSADAPPDRLFAQGTDAQARTVSRLFEMQSADYLARADGRAP